MSQKQEEFTGWRKILWPIHNHELKKVLPMAFIMFAILFNYTLLRDTKDSIIVNAGGAAMIPTLKLWFVTPMAILFVIAYVKLSNTFSREKMFYITLTPLLVYFVTYAFIIYPNLHYFQPSIETADAWRASSPALLHTFITVAQFWAHSLFYILSEIWGSAGISLLFWQFANEVTKTNEAKRIYVFYGFIANISLIFSGQYVNYFSDIKDKVAPGVDPWQVSLHWLMGGVLFFGILSMVIYRWLNTSVLTDPRFAPEVAKEPKKKKAKPGLGESIKLVLTSPYLMLIAVLVMAYGITINLVEVTWKEQLKIQYPLKNDYNAFMGHYSTITGVLTMIAMIIGSNLLRSVRWTTAAVITPLLILVAGGLFFAFILFRDYMEHILNHIGTTALFAAVILGAGLVILSKAIKYALFDPTKEMAYIPLDDDLKAKGKAVVDVVGGRAGKAGGSLIMYLLLHVIFLTPLVSDVAGYAAVIFIAIALIWVYAVKALGIKVEDAVSKHDAARKKA